MQIDAATLEKNWQYLENVHICMASSSPVVMLSTHPSEFLVHFHKEAHNIFFIIGKGKKRETTRNPLTGYRQINVDINNQRNIMYSIENEWSLLELHQATWMKIILRVKKTPIPIGCKPALGWGLRWSPRQHASHQPRAGLWRRGSCEQLAEVPTAAVERAYGPKGGSGWGTAATAAMPDCTGIGLSIRDPSHLLFLHVL